MFADGTTAMELLNAATARNPGKWRGHSLHTGFAARKIAEHAGLDPEKAWSLGLLHDIGRGRGVTGMRHIIDGYNDMMAQGFDENAVICLTHSYPFREVDSYLGETDCTPAELAMLDDFLQHHTDDDYDRLIQLCDALALPDRICVAEQRMIDVALRHGLNEYSIPRWKITLELKAYFEQKMGQDLYRMFGDDLFRNCFPGEG